MKKTLLFAILFLFTSAASSFAQTDNPERQYLSDSSSALQFQIGSNFTLSSFQGSTISYKYHLSRTSALRGGLSLDLSSGDREDGTDNFANDTIYSISNGNTDSKSFRIQIRMQYIYYFNPGSKFLLYTGAGPLFGYEKTNYKNETITNVPGFAPAMSIADQKRSSSYAGISGLLGVEWFASSGISLSAEYGLDIRYIWDKENQEQKRSQISYPNYRTVSSSKLTGWQIYGNSVKFGLSVYFM